MSFLTEDTLGNAAYNTIQKTFKKLLGYNDASLFSEFYKLYEKAVTTFFEQHKQEFGTPESSFLANTENLEIIIKSALFYGGDLLSYEKIYTSGFGIDEYAVKTGIKMLIRILENELTAAQIVDRIVKQKNDIRLLNATNNKVNELLKEQNNTFADLKNIKENVQNITDIPQVAHNGQPQTNSVTDHCDIINSIDLTQLEAWLPKKAKIFLLDATPKRCKTRQDEKTAEVLAELLGCLPLLMRYAAIYINTLETSFQKYIDKFNSSKERFKTQEQHENRLAVVWGISFERAKREEKTSEEIAYLFAYLQGESIPAGKMLEGIFEKDNIRNALASLAKFKFIENKDGLVYMHSLVQHFLRERLSYEKRTKCYIESVLNILLLKFNFLGEINSHEELEYIERLHYQVIHFLKNPECRQISPEKISVLSSKLGLYLYGKKGYYEEAIKYLSQPLHIHRELGSMLNEAFYLGNIGLVCKEKGDLDGSLNYILQALDIYKETNYKKDTAILLSTIASIFKAKAKHAQALGYYTQALDIYREIACKQEEAAQLADIGLIYSSKGEPDQALVYHLQALDIHRELGCRQGEANQLDNIALLYQTKGNLDQALTYHNQTLDIYRKIDYILGEANQLSYIGLIYRAKGVLDEAVNYLLQALDIHKELGCKQGEAVQLGNIGLLLKDIGKLDEALNYFLKAFEIHRELGYTQGEATQLGNIGLILKAKGKPAQALGFLLESLKIHREIGYKQGEVNQLSNISLILKEDGELDQALYYLSQALEIVQTHAQLNGKDVILNLIEESTRMKKSKKGLKLLKLFKY